MFQAAAHTPLSLSHVSVVRCLHFTDRYGTVKGAYYWKACKHDHHGVAVGGCKCGHQEADLSDTCLAFGGRYGEHGVGTPPCVTTSAGNDRDGYVWLFRAQSQKNVCGTNNVGWCTGAAPGCNVHV